MAPNVRALAAALIDRLAQQGWTLSLAESCTGGLLGAYLTSYPNASSVFTHGFICYSNLAKMDILGVELHLMERCGAVCEAVAVQMAEGAAAAGRSDVGLGLTGIAGPGGGTPTKPVGLVYGAISVRGAVQSTEWRFEGNRDSIREASVKSLLTFANASLRGRETLRRDQGES